MLISGADKTSYIYDEFYILSEKILPNANKEVMSYFPGGYLRSLEMHDSLQKTFTFDVTNMLSKLTDASRES